MSYNLFAYAKMLLVPNASIKAGVDGELDQKRRLHNGLPDLLRLVAQEECDTLPAFIQVCTVCYLPQVGYLIAVPRARNLEDQGINFKQITGLDFVFESNGAMHYRNQRTRELDREVGDVQQELVRLESGLVAQLTEALLGRRNELDAAVGFAAALDCQLALALVSQENGWVQPRVVEEGELRVTEGRHPLQQLTLTNFVPNDSRLGGRHGRIHLLSGPNNSGKSVYMKSVGLIVYLAHLGCRVPATRATVPLTDRILTRIVAVESISLGQSSFMCDLNQLGAALSSSSSRSLLLVDEFGKGTAGVDGAALLAAALLQLISHGHAAPLSIFSTHLHAVAGLLPSPRDCPHLRLKQMEAESFRVMEGFSSNSQAAAVAAQAGLPEQAVTRATQLQTGQPASLHSTVDWEKILGGLATALNIGDNDDLQAEAFLLSLDTLDI